MRALLAVLAALVCMPCGAQGVQSTPAAPGLIRAWGNDRMRTLLAAWQEGFAKVHPGVRFDDRLYGTGSGMAGIITGSSELAVMGRPATANEIKGFEWVFRNKPFGVRVANGALAGEGDSAPLAVLVSTRNPLAQMNVAQLRAVLGCPVRPGLLPTWSALGVRGPLAAHHIHAYLPDMMSNTGAFLHEAIEGERECWNWDIVTEFHDTPGATAGQQSAAALARDPDGLALDTLDHIGPGLKVVPLAGEAAAVLPTAESVRDESYPLARGVYLYLNRRKGQPVDPLLREYLDYILSPAGQALVPSSSRYQPLSPAAAGAQADALN